SRSPNPMHVGNMSGVGSPDEKLRFGLLPRLPHRHSSLDMIEASPIRLGSTFGAACPTESRSNTVNSSTFPCFWWFRICGGRLSHQTNLGKKLYRKVNPR